VLAAKTLSKEEASGDAASVLSRPNEFELQTPVTDDEARPEAKAGAVTPGYIACQGPFSRHVGFERIANYRSRGAVKKMV
jgi:hypothetical protein